MKATEIKINWGCGLGRLELKVNGYKGLKFSRSNVRSKWHQNQRFTNKKNEQLEVGKQSTKNNNLFQELLYHQGEPLKDKNN